MNKTRQMILNKKSIIATLAVLMSSPVLSQPWYHSTEGVDSAWVQNTSSEPTELWLTRISDSSKLPEEYLIEVEGHETKQIKLSDYSEVANSPVLQFKSYKEVPIKIAVQKNSYSVLLPPGRSSSLEFDLNMLSTTANLTISNLIPFGQEGRIRIINIFGQESHYSLSMNANETKSLQLTLKLASKIFIDGDYSLSANLEFNNNNRNTNHIVAKPVRSIANLKPENKGSYFLMSDPENKESFIFHTTDKNLIEQARAQIQGLNYKKILVAHIQMGHGNMNRDLHSPLKNTWSWSVSEAIRFADIGSLDCDGNPEIVEDTLNWWLESKNGIICFWHYKIERELGLNELNP